ncbi:MAG: hypothetical protein IPH02_08250 [Sphingobacteriales bacterium]|nr:hypothetical protein [Sphingobacteriales bacterium]MBK6889913.1 hypothetical protein [Sphingobacteriales bacterium]MBK6889915.1 hypothetical protein [Sphingobacteriales bacterium]MBK6889916.1 hypothetical protein [Sphingobacteriales bacterium]
MFPKGELSTLLKAKSNISMVISAGSWSSSSPPFLPSWSVTLSSAKSSVSPGSLKLSSFGVESISATALPSLSSAELISAQLRIGPATTAVTVKVISTAVL